MNTILANWKTTGTGVASILTALGDIFSQLSTSGINTGHISTDITAIVAGIGLIAAGDAKATTPTK